MKPSALRVLALVATLALGACSRDPLKGVPQAFAAGDLVKAEALLDEVLAGHPDLIQGRMYRLVLDQHLLQLDDASRKAELTNRVFEDYDWLTDKLGVKRDYSNIEASFAASPEGAAAYETARKALYRETAPH